MNASLAATFEPSLLNGVEELHGTAVQLSRDDQDQISETSHEIRAIPYFAWANRGRSEMMVWIPDTEKSARIKPHPTIASTSKTTSSPGGKNLISLNDLATPASSNDSENTFFDWWPHKGEKAWVEYSFAKEATVSTTSVYWFDDTGTGECRVPQSWRILYKDGEQWKPVETSGPFGVDRDQYNKVSFAPVTTTALRLEVEMRPGWSTGIQEWTVP